MAAPKQRLRSIEDKQFLQVIADAQTAAIAKSTRTITVDGMSKTTRRPFPSPIDWRDSLMYMLMIDRFNNPSKSPKKPWNQVCDVRQGGTFEGIRQQLGYLSRLGVNAIWITSPLKNCKPDTWKWNYHGYAAQDFLNLDARFASDGTLETAERELTALVDEAHGRDMYVILDIVLNHSGRVFDYVRNGVTVDSFTDPAVLNGPLGSEPHIQWLNGLGFPRAEWEDKLPPPNNLSTDDAVWPSDLQNHLFFRRRGSKISDTPDWRGFVPGDFGSMRQFVMEYDASVPGQESIRAKYGTRPVLDILVRAYTYLMARYDFDGYRIDTVKYIDPKIIETFGNAMREYAMSIGKSNFFTFGEIYGDETSIADFIGRNAGSSGEGFGVDAALDFPLFYRVPSIAKGFGPVEGLQQVFDIRKNHEEELLSSHGEASRYFVTFADNHDQQQRFKHPTTPDDQVKLGLTLLLTLQGIPCLYYGTEQSLQGTVAANGTADLTCLESVREALWGKQNAFNESSPMFLEIQALAKLRQSEPALRYGRQYFRQVSTDGVNFGYSYGSGGVVAYSRILGDRELLIVANTGTTAFNGRVVVDSDLNTIAAKMYSAYPASPATVSVDVINGTVDGAPAKPATVAVTLAPHEVRIWSTPPRAVAAVPLVEKVAA